MTTLPASASGVSAHPQRTLSAAPAAPAAGGSTIDPLKLLNKYKFLLIGAAVLGAVVGVGAHLILRKVYPVWTPSATFQCLASTNKTSEFNSAPSTEEMLRFMQTQVRIMTSSQVLQKVAEDPSLRTNAPKWSGPFMTVDASNGTPAFDSAEALKELKDDVRARVIPGTNLIELSMKASDKHDATAVVGLVRQQYMSLVKEQGSSGINNRMDAIKQTIDRLDQESQGLSLQKEQLISTGQVDSIDSRVEANRQELAETNLKLIEVQQMLDSGRTRKKQMDAEWNNPGGIAFGDELKSVVDKDPQILDLRTMIQRFENDQQALLQMNLSRDHRQYVTLQAQIDATKQNLEAKREELLKKAFAAQLESTRNAVAELEAQESTLVSRRDAAQKRLQDLTRLQSKYNDLNTRLEGVTQTRTSQASDLANLLALSKSETTNRVLELERERVPNEMSFPKLKMLLPAGIAFFLFLTGATVLLIEIVDQRVKGPGDIAIIPRARLVGWVPDASEDPAGAGAVETAFRDRPKGVLAESFRQVRATLLKRIQSTDHRVILITSGMPTSGATSVASNLALAFASADKRVLLIDANLRRPGLHRVFGIPETPGLADVLGRQKELAQAVQATSTPNLDLLPAGAKDQRVFERLSNDAMSELLAKARSMYDLVLVDVAPAVVGGDAQALAQRCDASILVVRAMADKRGMVARIKNELSETKSEFLGVIVNGVKSATGGYMKRNIRTAHEYHNA